MANQTLCHPFDTVRTRLQTTPQIKSVSSCIQLISRNEGLAAFYKGTRCHLYCPSNRVTLSETVSSIGFSAPFAAQAVYKSILFSVNGASQEWIKRQRRMQGQSELLSHLDLLACGALSGCTNSLVVTPVELLRNQLMMQISHKRFNGPSDIISWLWRRSEHRPFAFIRGMYRGWSATLCRDGLAVPVWFLGFHLVVTGFQKEGDHSEVSFAHLALAGSTGGILFWTVALPFDQVKSIIQAASIDQPAISLRSAVLRVRSPYRGWQVAFGRVSLSKSCI